jgi:hypothetical protein
MTSSIIPQPVHPSVPNKIVLQFTLHLPDYLDVARHSNGDRPDVRRSKSGPSIATPYR